MDMHDDFIIKQKHPVRGVFEITFYFMIKLPRDRDGL